MDSIVFPFMLGSGALVVDALSEDSHNYTSHCSFLEFLALSMLGALGVSG